MVLYAENEPDPDPITKWGAGILGPLLMAGFGTTCFLRRIEGMPLRGKSGTMTLFGGDAILLGSVVLLAAFCIHVHFFWSQTTRLKPYYEVVRVVGTIITILVLCVLAFRLFRLTFDI